MDAITQFDLNITPCNTRGYLLRIPRRRVPEAHAALLPVYRRGGGVPVFQEVPAGRRCDVRRDTSVAAGGKPPAEKPRRQGPPCWIDPDFLQLLVSVPKDFSFPSAHTMISVSAAAALFHYSKALGDTGACHRGSGWIFAAVPVRTFSDGRACGRGHRSPSCRGFVYRHGQDRGKDKEQKGSQLILPNSFRKEAVFALQAV